MKKPNKRIAIYGGGVAGLSAAQELIERGFDVDVYERTSTLGGKAKSVIHKSHGHHDSNGNVIKYPGEHGFRFFPRYYKNIRHTMKRIPLPDGGHVHDNLVNVDSAYIARENLANIEVPTRFPRSASDIKKIIALLKYMDGLTRKEQLIAIRTVWQIATSCNERLDDEYECVPWWEFIRANEKSKDFQQLFAKGLTRSLVAAKAEEISTKTGGKILNQLIYGALRITGAYSQVLNRPTSEAWIDPWESYLEKSGVTFYKNHEAICINVSAPAMDKEATIRSVLLRDENSGTNQEIQADYHLFAIPVERMAPLVAEPSLPPCCKCECECSCENPLSLYTPNVGERDFKICGNWPAEYDTTLSKLPKLAEDVRWMNGIQYYLEREIPIVKGHVLYVDSDWAVTSISQRQFWDRKRPMVVNGNIKIKDILSVDISNWDTATELHDWDDKPIFGYDGKPLVKAAKNCSFEQVASETWYQIKTSLNTAGETDVIGHSDGHGGTAMPIWMMDPGIGTLDKEDTDKLVPPINSDNFTFIGKGDPKDYGYEPDRFTKIRERFSPRALTNAEPLLINKAGRWALRPAAYTQYKNLYLAADYVRSDADLATMEGANEAARRAVNEILSHSKCKRRKAKVYLIKRPFIFAIFRWYDNLRWERGLRWKNLLRFWK